MPLSEHEPMKEISVTALKEKMDAGEDFQLIDVREPYELEIASIGGDHIPMAQVPHELGRISKDKPVIIYCRSGNRSGNIAQWLSASHGFENVHNLTGGILAWADEVDPSVTKY